MNETFDDGRILGARVAVPEEVVSRGFERETVVLNLSTGRYHGLNPTASLMLKRLTSAARAGEAIPALAQELERPEEIIRADLVDLCRHLLARGLIRLEDAHPS